LLGKLGGRILRVFRFTGVSVNFGTAVTARRTGRRDRGGAGTSTVLNINDQTVWSRYMQIWSRNIFL
jgi:hypothetical protein